MKTTRLKALVLFASLLAASGGRADEGERLKAFKDLIDETAAVQESVRRPRLLSAYERLFPADLAAMDLRQLDDSELRSRFTAADLLSFYTNDHDDLFRYFGELQRRGQAKDLDYVSVFGAHVADRNFVEARKVKAMAQARGAALERLPAIDDATAGDDALTTLLSLERDGLARRHFDLEGFTGAVVVSHPMCHFSVNAMAAIAADPAVAAAMQDALWLAPQDRRLHFDVLQQWNSEHPAQQFHIAYREAEWKVIPAWATPHFHFFDRGDLVTDVEGWPSEGNMNAVRAGLASIGLLDAPGGNAEDKQEAPAAAKR